MKILYPFDNPEKALNPYVLTIVQGLKKNSSDLEIVCSIAEFWTTNDIFDIVHIMWPDMLLKEHFLLFLIFYNSIFFQKFQNTCFIRFSSVIYNFSISNY